VFPWASRRLPQRPPCRQHRRFSKSHLPPQRQTPPALRTWPASLRLPHRKPLRLPSMLRPATDPLPDRKLTRHKVTLRPPTHRRPRLQPPRLRRLHLAPPHRPQSRRRSPLPLLPNLLHRHRSQRRQPTAVR